ncbi:hypothetical protein GJ744_003219 [Endocarpon pusillum]|uniref:Uncharacterized protein n=1 Tax=Endocarpon pusillum TaxID=364733 RepID=A0A8H7DYC4_9EURO|nr:hypothetical protein GJ744_003219 [Endocarpon pusillum]
MCNPCFQGKKDLLALRNAVNGACGKSSMKKSQICDSSYYLGNRKQLDMLISATRRLIRIINWNVLVVTSAVSVPQSEGGCLRLGQDNG